MSRRLPVWQLYERARSLGLAVQVSAQSWEGLAAGEDERYRIAATADGGIWLLRTPHPEPVAALAGSRKVTETTRHLTGRTPVWDHRGTSRVTLDPVVDPALIRALDVGQAAYIFRGGVTYVQVKRLVTAPAAVGPATAGPVPAEPTTALRAAGAAGARSHARAGAAAAAGRRFAARRGIRRGARPMTRQPAADPFRALGLEPRAGLTDDEVHAAWRRTASATHPDREDGGDPERFAEAAAAYTALRTRFGRGEVLADLGAGRAVAMPSGWRRVMARLLGSRVWRGRPGPARAAGPGRRRGLRGRRYCRRPAPGRSRPGHRRGNLAGADRPPRPRSPGQPLTCIDSTGRGRFSRDGGCCGVAEVVDDLAE